MLRPPPVRAGDTVYVVAPSGPFDRALFFRALAWLSKRYRVCWDRGCLEKDGFLAGSDRRRLAELEAALADPNARAVIAARGGYGAGRICHAADLQKLRTDPKWCVGFSDFTALHLEATRAGVCSLHAPNLTALGRSDAGARAAFVDAIEDPFRRRAFTELDVLISGHAAGLLAGGNLSLIFSAAASGRLKLPAPCLLFVEEVNEAPYRIDRMLTALIIGGHLRSVVGVCVGDLGDEKRGSSSPALAVVQERCAELNVPVLAGLPIGHGSNNRPLPLGVMGELNSRRAELIVNADQH